MTIARSSGLINAGFAQGLATFRSATVPSLADEFPQAPHWIANYLLNSMYAGSFGPKAKPIVLGFIRRTHLAFAEYHRARETTLLFLDRSGSGSPAVMPYYDAVAQWEDFIVQMSMGFDLFNWLRPEEKAFRKNDGSKEDRLYTIGNQIKHSASCISSGQADEADLLPLWLTDAGINSFGVLLNYDEAAAVLRDASKVAELLENPEAFVASRQRARATSSRTRFR